MEVLALTLQRPPKPRGAAKKEQVCVCQKFAERQGKEIKGGPITNWAGDFCTARL